MAEEQAQVIKFHIEYKLDATVTINGNSWVKPGVSAGITFNDIPTSAQLQAGSKFLIGEVVEPLLGQVIESVAEQTLRAEGITPV